MGKKHRKKQSPSVAIREMQIKTTLRFHLTSVSMATTNNKCWQGCGIKETSYTAGENVSQYNHYEKCIEAT
jgi:hypothetical protein